jgi:hypothetical protein
MSWMRTAAALIGFSFAIVPYFELLQQSPGAVQLQRTPRYLGLARIAAGVLELSTWPHRPIGPLQV